MNNDGPRCGITNVSISILKVKVEWTMTEEADGARSGNILQAGDHEN